jgi:hypothetical protein
MILMVCIEYDITFPVLLGPSQTSSLDSFFSRPAVAWRQNGLLLPFALIVPHDERHPLAQPDQVRLVPIIGHRQATRNVPCIQFVLRRNGREGNQRTLAVTNQLQASAWHHSLLVKKEQTQQWCCRCSQYAFQSDRPCKQATSRNVMGQQHSSRTEQRDLTSANRL